MSYHQSRAVSEEGVERGGVSREKTFEEHWQTALVVEVAGYWIEVLSDHGRFIRGVLSVLSY